MKNNLKTAARSFLRSIRRALLKGATISDSLVRNIRQKPSQLDVMLTMMRTFEERSQTLDFLLRTVEERSQTLEFLSRMIEERSQTLEERSQTLEFLLHTVEERSQTLEFLLHTVEERSQALEFLSRTVDERSQTLEYLARESLFAMRHQIDQLHKLYVESAPALLGLNQRAAFNASRILELKTEFPIAVGSNDHISPDSTTEGLSRPTFFVQNCISVLGQNIKCLDLGSGAAGLVFEFAMNQVFAIGIDGSDFCRVNKIGYWPILPNNLFTCDITKPFSFLSKDTETPINFDIITMWEVLEHIAESDLSCLFSNINRHLGNDAYLIGSISLVEYVDNVGKPYHVTLKPRDWWKTKLIESGLVMLDAHPFNEKLFCRGNGPRFQDFHNYALNPGDGFLFVARKMRDGEQVFA